MPSAPAGGARAPAAARTPAPIRRAASASPARVGGSPTPARRRVHSASPRARRWSPPRPMMRRRAYSASPGVRRWSPPRTRGTSLPRPRRGGRSAGPGRAGKVLTGLLALQGALMGHTPYVGAPGKALAVWPLGTRGPNYFTLGKTYNYGQLAKYPVIERVKLRRPLTCGRKACLGGEPNSRLYEPRMVRANIYGTKVPRKHGNRASVLLPAPVISAANVLRLEAQGYQLPKSVLKQAHAGLPILANAKPSKRAQELLANKDPRMLPAIFEVTRPIPSRFNRTNQLALPAGVQRKLQALENRARSMAASGTAKAVTFPYKVAAKARNAAGRAAASVARGAASVAQGVRYTAALPGRGKRALGRMLSAQNRRLPN